MRAPKHFACAVIYRRGREGAEILLMNSQFSDSVTGHLGEERTKFPGGDQKHSDESPIQTLMREGKEETGLKIERAIEVCKLRVSIYPHHTQYGFLVDIDDCRGNLRTKPIRDGREVLYPPRWVPAYVIIKRRDELYQPRREIYLAAFRVLRDLDLLRPRS